jgi:hypothetical protein
MENVVDPISVWSLQIRRTSFNRLAGSLPELNIECCSD